MTSLDEFEKLVNSPYNDTAKFILTDTHRTATKDPAATPEITGWREISPASLHIDLYRFCSFADAFSSLYVDNIGTEPLRIRFLVHASLMWEKFVAPGSRQLFEFFSEPYPRCALPFSEVSVEFSHAEYRSKIRYLFWTNEIHTARMRENPVMMGKRTDNNLTHVYFAYNGMFKPLQWHNDLPAEDLQGYVLSSVLKQSHVPHPRNRLYEWVGCLPEPEPGKYILPAEPQIYSSIYVENPTDEPITLRLLPNFRHKYTLQPGINLLELFWQEFWREGGTDGDYYYLQSRTSGLKISLRIGNQRAGSVRYPVVPPTYNETARILISPDYYVYRGGGKLTACYNRKDLAQSTCLLGLHSRTGKDSSLRAYFQDHPLSERYLLPEIWRFL